MLTWCHVRPPESLAVPPGAFIGQRNGRRSGAPCEISWIKVISEFAGGEGGEENHCS